MEFGSPRGPPAPRSIGQRFLRSRGSSIFASGPAETSLLLYRPTNRTTLEDVHIAAAQGGQAQLPKKDHHSGPPDQYSTQEDHAQPTCPQRTNPTAQGRPVTGPDVPGGLAATAHGRLAAVPGGLAPTAHVRLAAVPGGLAPTAHGRPAQLSQEDPPYPTKTSPSVPGGPALLPKEYQTSLVAPGPPAQEGEVNVPEAPPYT